MGFLTKSLDFSTILMDCVLNVKMFLIPFKVSLRFLTIGSMMTKNLNNYVLILH
jgi:hypothetical protein